MKQTFQRIYDTEQKNRLEIIFYYVESSLSNGDLKTVNKFIKDIDKEKLDYIDLIAILRVTFRVNKVLPHWKSFYKDTRKILKKSKLDYKTLMRGL